MSDRNEPENMIVCENLVKIYKTAEIEVIALQGLDLTVDRGEVMAIIGNSGSGKSTLLNMLGGLDRPSAGSLSVNGKDLLKMNDKQLVKYKRETVGFVWQNNARNLIPYLSALENVEMPMIFDGRKKRYIASELLDMVGLKSRKKNRLEELSGGEQQRVAIAIAMSNNPKLLLADEPTGAVDSMTTQMILDVFNELNRITGITIVIVTHDRQISKKVNRVVAIRDGRTSSEFVRRESYREEIAGLGNMISEDEEHQEELAVLDRAGRVQIPKEYLDAAGIKGNRIRLEREEGRIVIVSPESAKQDEGTGQAAP